MVIMGKKEKTKKLMTNMILFTVGNMGSRLLVFFLVPLYTYALSTADYGIADLVSTTAFLLIPIMTLNIQDAVLRYGLDSMYDTKAVLSVGIKLNFIGAIVTAGLCMLAALLNLFKWNWYVYFFLFFIYFFGAINNCMSFYLKACDEIKLVTISGIINTAITCLLNIVALIVLKCGLVGYLSAYMLGSFFSSVYLFLKGHLYAKIIINPDKTVEKEMIHYSKPLILNSVAWWINNSSDRFIVTYFCGVAVNGIYSVAYKIPSILTTLQTVFYNAWSISAVTEFDSEDSDGFIGKTYSVYCFLNSIACSIIMIFSIPIAKVLYQKEFFIAWTYTPFLLVGTFFCGISLFQGCIFTAVKQTVIVSKTTILGAVINTFFNIILIFCIGAQGAAISTMLGYFSTFLGRHIYLRRFVDMKMNWTEHFVSIIILIVQACVAGSYNNVIYEIVLFALLLIVQKDSIKIFFDKRISK